LSRISLAFSSFFGILFGGELPAGVAKAFGYSKSARPAEAPKAPAPVAQAGDGAVQMLAVLQRDSRLVDFLMEDISGASDDQVGAAVRMMHEQSKQTLQRYVTLVPVIDGVEGTYTKLGGTKDPAAVKLIGNVPADGKAPGGTLRHKGWRAEKLSLPVLNPRHDLSIVMPAEIEVE
jgi:hypothetical protein